MKVVQKDIIYVYNIYFLRQGSQYYKVKGISLQKQYQFQDPILRIDLDFSENYLVVQKQQNLSQLEFYRFSNLEGDTKIQVGKPLFYLNFSSEINDFFFQKELYLEELSQKNFLIIYLKQNFFIYSENEKNIFSKVFSLSDQNFTSKETKFKFLVNTKFYDNHDQKYIKGVLFLMKNNIINLYVLSNLFFDKQSLIEDHYLIQLNNFQTDQILSIHMKKLDEINIITYSKNFIFMKYKLHREQNEFSSKFKCFRLINNAIEAKDIIYNYKSKYVYGKLLNENQIFLELKNHYDDHFCFRLLHTDNQSVLEQGTYTSLIDDQTFVAINLHQKTLTVQQILQNQQHAIQRDKIELDLLKEHFIDQIKYIIINKQYFCVLIKTQKELVILYIEIEEFKVKNIEKKYELEFSQICDSQIEYFELILQQEKKLIYRLFVSNQSQQIITIDLNVENKEESRQQVQINGKILEIYKNNKHPFNYIVLTEDNTLHFYTNSLEQQCCYDLDHMGLNLNKNPNNFNFKYMYNNFYIFYCFSNIYVGKLVYKFQENRFEFQKINLDPFYLKELNYQINWNSHIRDKIVYFNHKNVCIRNSQKLVYGNLYLKPKEQQSIIDEPSMNLHKYLLLKNFKFSFFNDNSVIDCLTTGKKYYLYNLLYNFIQQDKPKFQFDPENVQKTLFMNKKEFQEVTNLQNEQQYIQLLEDFDINNLPENKRQFFQDGINIIKDIEEKSQSLDIPSQILYLQHKYNLKGRQMTSEMVVMAICSDQKQFLFQNFFPNCNPMTPPTWEQLKEKCVVYWYEDIQDLKRMIDRSSMAQYKKNKKVFEILLWFVILGKVKLLVPLFKLEPGQQKFVQFFNSNFNDQKIQEQAINNAYKLKSCKKFDLCVAFFILAKQYAEAMTITLEHMNDPQLTVLLYRLSYQQIQQFPNQQEEIDLLLKNHFFKQGEILNENFLQAIYFHITEQTDLFVQSLIDAKKTKKFLYFQDQLENYNYGFRLVNYSTNLVQLFQYLEKSSSYKRYFKVQTAEEQKENLKLLWKNFYYYYLQEQIYQALVCMIEIKILDEDFFQDKISKHNKLFKEIFSKICLKRLKKVIKHKEYWRLKFKDENNQELVDYFGLDYTKIKKKIQRRINLVDDFELSLFNDLLEKDYDQAEIYFKKLQKKLLTLNRKLLKRDIFKYDSNHNWIEKINFVEKFIQMLNNLFISSDEFYLDMFRKHKDEFSDLIIFWLFQISINSNCWEEAIDILENYKIFDILSENFTKILQNLRSKILNKFKFIRQSPIVNTEDLEFNYSNVNILVFLFIKGLYFDSFLEKRSQKDSQSFNSNLIPLQLGKSLQEFLGEIQNQFFQLLKSFTFEEQKMIYNEFKELFDSDMATIQRLNFFILTPLEAIKIEENKKFKSDCLVKQKWYDKIQDFVYLFLLKENYICESKEKIEIKNLLFKKGIEIFKLRSDQNTMNFFSSGLIQKILIIEHQNHPEIFILINKKIRKIYLYNALFKEERTNDGYNLKNYDNINSISVVSENIVTLSEEFLQKKPFMSRILYQLFFQKNNTQSHNHCKQVYERIIDTKIQKREDFNNVTIIEKHEELPIMFVAQQEKLFIVSNKTLAILCHYSSQSLKKIKYIIPDKKGFRILVIDENHNAYILKFDLSFNNILMIHEIKDKQIYHGNWNEDSTQIYFATNTQNVLVFDLIEISFKEFKMDNHNIPKSHIYYVKKIDQVLIMNRKYQFIGIYDKENLQEIEQTTMRQSDQIFCYAISDKKEILVLGHQNGEIRYIDLRTLEQVDLKTFDDNEGKRLKVSNIAFVKDFLICSFSNGIVSIIDKI